MTLKKYRQKRHFEETPEPQGGAHTHGALRFVVQKHHASRLHYDFRLELDGVLKSWAVPKGPSLNPADKRLAMMVEDHPLDYATFEGVIPAGNYGAGTVMVWDRGTYHARAASDRKTGEQLLREGLEKGHITFVLNGKKLRGEFALLKLRRGEPNAWLLVKKADEFAENRDVSADDRSVKSKRTLDEVAQRLGKSGEAWHKNGRQNRQAPARLDVDDAAAGKMPHKVKPMLATLVDQAFDRPGWIFEIKWDGYRAIAEVHNKVVRLYSRNLKSFNDRYPPVVTALSRLGHDVVLDGEIVVVDDNGMSQFQLLQNYQSTGQGTLIYYVFDILYADGRNLQELPLMRRREILQQLIKDVPNVRLSEHVAEKGKAFYEAADRQGLEGIIAKNGASAYMQGVRSESWLKVKVRRRQEAVIGGFTEPRGSRKDFGALVLGVYESDRLAYIGHTGGGFNSRSLAEVKAKLLPLEQKTCPFKKRPATNAPVHWLKPELVCEVNFQSWTDDGHMRMPIFVGLREDKPATDVRRETVEPVQEALADEPASHKKASSPRSRRRVAENAAQPTLTHLDKVYWPELGYTKGDLIDYYREVAPMMLPYLHDRPESMNRHPNGVKGPNFFQKDVSKQLPPPWVQTQDIESDKEQRTLKYLLIQDEASLLYVANLGCIEINPWLSRIGSLDRPDHVVIDLDPEDIEFARVVVAAQAVRRTLDRAGAECLCKTSGKTGLHLYVPLGARYDYDQAKTFAELVANVVSQQLPETTSVVRSPAQRQKRVYLDFLQNRRGQTLAAPYSVRPTPSATVSTPLRWSEVKRGLDPSRFTIRTVPKRLQSIGDLWKPVLEEGADLLACLERLEKSVRRGSRTAARAR